MPSLKQLIDRVLPPGSGRRIGTARIGRTLGLLRSETSPPIDPLSVNYRNLEPAAIQELEQTLRTLYFNHSPAGYLETQNGKEDLLGHLTDRLENARKRIVPFLDKVKPLKGARILEVGGGTGSDLVAFAEQGALVTSIDIEEAALEVAKKRCALYGVIASLHHANATHVRELLGHQEFDFIIFYACLEHMTCEERVKAISDTWQMLQPGKYWSVIETPNRLWYRDDHTSLMPFFHWLPDELAFQYSRFSPRANFNDRYRQISEESMHDFLRRGRGVSFHEFVLAIGSLEKAEVVGYFNATSAINKASGGLPERYIQILSELTPEIHPAFLQPNLELILRKPLS